MSLRVLVAKQSPNNEEIASSSLLSSSQRHSMGSILLRDALVFCRSNLRHIETTPQYVVARKAKPDKAISIAAKQLALKGVHKFYLWTTNTSFVVN